MPTSWYKYLNLRHYFRLINDGDLNKGKYHEAR